MDDKRAYAQQSSSWREKNFPQTVHIPHLMILHERSEWKGTVWELFLHRRTVKIKRKDAWREESTLKVWSEGFFCHFWTRDFMGKVWFFFQQGTLRDFWSTRPGVGGSNADIWGNSSIYHNLLHCWCWHMVKLGTDYDANEPACIFCLYLWKISYFADLTRTNLQFNHLKHSICT